jgi:hypothetical protein
MPVAGHTLHLVGAAVLELKPRPGWVARAIEDCSTAPATTYKLNPRIGENRQKIQINRQSIVI